MSSTPVTISSSALGLLLDLGLLLLGRPRRCPPTSSDVPSERRPRDVPSDGAPPTGPPTLVLRVSSVASSASASSAALASQDRGDQVGLALRAEALEAELRRDRVEVGERAGLELLALQDGHERREPYSSGERSRPRPRPAPAPSAGRACRRRCRCRSPPRPPSAPAPRGGPAAAGSPRSAPGSARPAGCPGGARSGRGAARRPPPPRAPPPARSARARAGERRPAPRARPPPPPAWPRSRPARRSPRCRCPRARPGRGSPRSRPPRTPSGARSASPRWVKNARSTCRITSVAITRFTPEPGGQHRRERGLADAGGAADQHHQRAVEPVEPAPARGSGAPPARPPRPAAPPRPGPCRPATSISRRPALGQPALDQPGPARTRAPATSADGGQACAIRPFE